jgi:hypothetical protein
MRKLVCGFAQMGLFARIFAIILNKMSFYRFFKILSEKRNLFGTRLNQEEVPAEERLFYDS